MSLINLFIIFFMFSVVCSKDPGLENSYLVQKIQDKKDLPIILADIQNQLKELQKAVGINAANIATNKAGIATNTSGIAANDAAIKSLAKAIFSLLNGLLEPLKAIPILGPVIPFLDGFIKTIQSLV